MQPLSYHLWIVPLTNMLPEILLLLVLLFLGCHRIGPVNNIPEDLKNHIEARERNRASACVLAMNINIIEEEIEKVRYHFDFD